MDIDSKQICVFGGVSYIDGVETGTGTELTATSLPARRLDTYSSSSSEEAAPVGNKAETKPGRPTDCVLVRACCVRACFGDHRVRCAPKNKAPMSVSTRLKCSGLLFFILPLLVTTCVAFGVLKVQEAGYFFDATLPCTITVKVNASSSSSSSVNNMVAAPIPIDPPSHVPPVRDCVIVNTCQEALDAYCNVPSHCLSHVSFKGPLHALRAGDKDGGSTAAWRCYGETSLESTNTHYTSGGDYCTKNAELAAINDAAPCNGTVPTATPAAIGTGVRGEDFTLDSSVRWMCRCVYTD